MKIYLKLFSTLEDKTVSMQMLIYARKSTSTASMHIFKLNIKSQCVIKIDVIIEEEYHLMLLDLIFVQIKKLLKQSRRTISAMSIMSAIFHQPAPSNPLLESRYL